MLVFHIIAHSIFQVASDPWVEFELIVATEAIAEILKFFDLWVFVETYKVVGSLEPWRLDV